MAEIIHELRMDEAGEFLPVKGLGTTSLEGLIYDGDPAEGGRPYVGLIFVLQDEMSPLLALPLEHVAGLIAELTHRVEVMGFGPALRALIDQHAVSAKEFADQQLFPATPVCGHCGAFADLAGNGPAAFDHEPGCPNAGPAHFEPRKGTES